MRTLLRCTQALCAVALLALWAGCSGETSTPLAIPTEGDGAGKGSQGVETLPQNIVDAVMKVMPGAELVSAVMEKEKGKVVYEVNVKVDGQDFEVEVDESGQVLEIEVGDDGD